MRIYLMEAIGTFFLVLAIGLTSEPLAIGLVLASMIYIGAHVSGAHFNPAVSFTYMLLQKITFKKFLGYISSQIVGAFVATGIIVIISTLPYYVEPPSTTTIYQQSISEVLFTFALVMVYLTVSSSKALTGNKTYGFIIGLAFAGLALLAAPISGTVLNPAVSIGSSMFDLLLGGASYLYIPLYTIAPLAGGALAGVTYRYLNY